MKLSLPGSAAHHELTLPEKFQFDVVPGPSAQVVPDADIAGLLSAPIGMEPLAERVKGKKTVAILSDDITRPTPVFKVLPGLLNLLSEAGIRKDDIFFIMATGGHRAMTRGEMIEKLGETIVSEYEIMNHNPYQYLKYYGKSPAGIPIHINRFAAEADVRIGISSIFPHHAAGFSGGAKIITPGVAGMETIVANHSLPYGKINHPDECPIRKDMEDIARMVGLDFNISVLINEHKDIIGLFAGDFVKSHRAASAFAQKVYTASYDKKCDIVIANPYPMDSDLFQIGKGMWPCWAYSKDNGVMILAAECCDGIGYHAVYRKGGPLFHEQNEEAWKKRLGGKTFAILSPTLQHRDLLTFYPKATVLLRSYEECERFLCDHFSGQQMVTGVLFPCSTLQHNQ